MDYAGGKVESFTYVNKNDEILFVFSLIIGKE